ncbi:MAG: PQQ-binding-like beta-propeller repeat protein [Candidatus Omnitrophica bacterium]|nr:PQQ-binding-like beta-propeller repeat protein [Candidatus Omnitrophota bacterium]
MMKFDLDENTKRERLIGRILVCALAIAGILSIYFWYDVSPGVILEARVPGIDGESLSASGQTVQKEIVGKLTRSSGSPADLTGAWPCFRGPDLDNICKEEFKPWPKGSKAATAWAIDVGEGFAGAVILDGRVYLMDYDREQEEDALRCLSLADGEEIWRYSYPMSIKRNHGMSRTVPSVTKDWLIGIGPKCHVTCLDSESGEKKWMIDMVRDFGAEVPPWYAGQCPLIDGNRLILAPGGTALITAVDCETGEIIWETPNPNDWKMTHSSVMPMEFNGVRMYVYCASGGVVGASAEDGRILWEYPDWKISIANVPSPLTVGDGKIFLSGGYKAGSAMLQLKKVEDRIEPQLLFRLEPERFGATQHTPILFNDCIFGVRPDGQFVCLDLDGNEKWASGGAYKFGLGSFILAGSLFYVLNDSGLLSRVEADAGQFRLVDQMQILEGHDSWGPIACASGRMILRDMTRMICLEEAQ